MFEETNPTEEVTETREGKVGCGLSTVLLTFLTIFILALVAGLLVMGILGDRESSDAHDQMMETSFQSSPGLKTTFNKLQAEIDKWKESEEKFTRLEKAAQTAGGRSLAKEKLAGIGQVLSKLTESREKTLEQIEMIAIESEGQFTELDRKALDDLSLKVEDSVRDARELREGLADE
ncbi:hypothetical protein N9A97_00320 [bacterium]|nr:hypothetical protein [Akkermansiaceae bacterium]MDA7898499.1 hypothetical protein [bacterium]MDA8967327.1 hypothetical protein [Akkermansiaceae bacterium]MDB4458220.1 hypothetical protein [Akkermansiaceae bacterium]MDB4462794.1 hypothetical protein [Akkermansiaceae bacterium]